MVNPPSFHETPEGVATKLWAAIAAEVDWYPELGEVRPDDMDGRSAGRFTGVLMYFGPT